MRRFISQAFCLILLLLVGCSARPYPYAGKWFGQRSLKARPGEDQTILNTIGMVKLEIFENGSFEMFDSGLPKRGESEISDGKLLLHVKTIMDQPVDPKKDTEKPVELTPVDENHISFYDPLGFDSQPLKLKRETKP